MRAAYQPGLAEESLMRLGESIYGELKYQSKQSFADSHD